jgi:hypothetical protein
MPLTVACQMDDRPHRYRRPPLLLEAQKPGTFSSLRRQSRPAEGKLLARGSTHGRGKVSILPGVEPRTENLTLDVVLRRDPL